MDPELVDVLRQLVAIPSMNPYRSNILGEGYGEGRLARHVADFLREAGLAVELREVLPGRPNVVARLGGPGEASPLLFEAHLDTVPVEGMTVPPFEGLVRDGRLYGRGACDTKGSMAAMITALRRVARAGSNAAPVLFAATVNEESGYSGIRAFVKPPPRVRAAVVGEPTSLGIVVAHRGVARCAIETRGTSAHSSCPERGANAIYRMAPIVAELEALAARLQQRPPHPLVGGPRLSVGTIAGGLTVNTVPDRCVIEVDRRLVPGETADEAFEALRALAERHGASMRPFFQAGALDTSRDAAIVLQAVEAARAVLGEARIAGAPYATNASELAEAGIAAIVLGPGDSAQAHAADEFVALDQLEAACRIYQHLMTGGAS